MAMVKSYNGEMFVIPKEFEEDIRADERAKVIEILKKCVFEIPYENSAFGYGTKAIDYSKAMKMLKEQK